MSSFWDKSWDEILLECEKQQTDWIECDKVNIYLRDSKGQIKSQAYQITQKGGSNEVIKSIIGAIDTNKKNAIGASVTKLDDYNTMIEIPNSDDNIIINKGTCIITEDELFNNSRGGDIKKLVSFIG